MQSNLTREQALSLLKTYNKEPFHIQHALTVEGVMRWYANELGYGADADYWATVGLLHDIDFENWPLMRPSKSVMDMEVSSVKKKFKDKKFAAGCSRDVIAEGAQRLGWELTDLMDRTLRAMQSCEESIRKEMQG